MIKYAALFAGGGLGALLRFLSAQAVIKIFAASFPAGTLAVNEAGSLALGFLYKMFAVRAAPPELRLFLVTGFLGGYTTFSSYALATANLLLEGRYRQAAANFILNNALCLIFVIAGMVFEQWVVDSG
jgi:CrcB protein